MRGVDYYELLGVNRSASAAEIKSAYRALAKVMHPDAGGTAGTFRLLQDAHETLNDPVRRAAYDRGSGSSTPVRATPSRPRPRPRPRRQNLEEDADFVPSPPRFDPRAASWWQSAPADGQVRLVPPLGPARESVLAVVGGWCLLLLPLLLPVDVSPPLFVLWLLLVVAGTVAVFRLARSHLVASRVDRDFEVEFAGRIAFGRPGTDSAHQAEQLTSTLLTLYLIRLPGVRIFHGLSLPGSVLADVDHAVLCGRRLVLIESKLWLPGHYVADETGELWRNGHRFRGGSSDLSSAVDSYRELLPDLEVRGAVLIYPSRAGEITTGESPEVSSLPMSPEMFVEEVGEWLAEDPATLDRDAFRTILHHVVS